MSSNESKPNAVTHQFLGVLVAAIGAAIVWVGMQLQKIVTDDISTTVVGAVLFVIGMGVACYGFVRDGRAAQHQ